MQLKILIYSLVGERPIVTQSITLGRLSEVFNCHTYLNPLSPDINMYILVTVLRMFLILLIERICSNIKTFQLW